MKTVDEKVAYNRGKNTHFSSGYVYGVYLYRAYPKMNPEGKALVKDLIAGAREGVVIGDKYNARMVAKYGAEFGQSRDEDYERGFLCGIRDAANERKARKGK